MNIVFVCLFFGCASVIIKCYLHNGYDLCVCICAVSSWYDIIAPWYNIITPLYYNITPWYSIILPWYRFITPLHNIITPYNIVTPWYNIIQPWYSNFTPWYNFISPYYTVKKILRLLESILDLSRIENGFMWNSIHFAFDGGFSLLRLDIPNSIQLYPKRNREKTESHPIEIEFNAG